MINLHIHQFQPGGAVVDAAALAQFQEQWETYRKLVESDCLAHREVGAILRETLNDVFASPFSFLDIACGDASLMKAALPGTPVRHYHGIDLSQPALELAAANLAGLPFEVDLDHRDFVEAMPEGTLKALADHGDVGAAMPTDGGDFQEVLARFDAAKIDVRALAARLQDEGAKAFVNSWNELMEVIGSKSDVLKQAS